MTRAFLAAATLLCLACAETPLPDRDVEAAVSDSAGIRVVTLGPLPVAPTIHPELVWRYGHEEGHYEIRSGMLGVALENGDVVFNDSGNAEVVRIHAGGAGHTLLATSGQGPAEVGFPQAAVRSGPGEVWVSDPRNRKLMEFSEDSLVFASSAGIVRELALALMPIGVAGDGSLLMTTSSFRTDFQTPWLNGSLVRFHPRTQSVDTVGAFPLARRVQEPINPFGPFGTVTSAAGHFIQGRTDIPELIWTNSFGQTVQITRWEAEWVYPNDELWEQYQASFASGLVRMNPGMSDAAVAVFVEEQLARYEVDPETPIPLFAQLRGTSDGGVWLSPYSPSGPHTSSYVLFSDSGTKATRVKFPEEFLLLDAWEGQAFGLVRDDFGVQSVAAFKL